MQLLRLDPTLEGRVLGETLYDENGQVLLRQGVILSSTFIDRLLKRGYTSVHVENLLAPDIERPSVIAEETRAEAVASLRRFSVALHQGKRVDAREVERTVERILSGISQSPDVIQDFHSIKTRDNYTFEHSVNVCVISLILMKALRYSNRDLIEVGQGALLHDIGKLAVPDEILLKPGRLTDEEYAMIQQHSQWGHDLLEKSMPQSRVPQIAGQHHERCDGSGYPQGCRGEEISRWSQLVAVVDVYDAITSDRIYRDKMQPHEAMHILEDMKGRQFPEDLVHPLTQSVAHYPMGSIVELHSGHLGVVARQDARASHRPHVRVLVDPDGIIIEQPEEWKLVEDPTITVKEVLRDYPAKVYRQIIEKHQIKR